VIVLDSSFLIAYYNTRDVHHAAAARTMVQLIGGKWGQGLLLEYVFLETVTVLRARRDLKVATTVGKTLLQASEIDFVPCSDIFIDAFDVFCRDRSHDLSFVDAAIVTVARQHSPGFVATFDEDFTALRGIAVVAG
jgi:predicted nucleic acid-binding protein